MTNPIDTPLVDEECARLVGYDMDCESKRVSADFARSLERRLTAANARIRELEREVERMSSRLQELAVACDEQATKCQEPIRGIATAVAANCRDIAATPRSEP